jgi:hypothetical protein
MKLIKMNQLAVMFIVVILYSCNFQAQDKKNELITQNLIAVSDSISLLMSEYHYNSNQLNTREYLVLEKRILSLAKKAKTKQEFVEGFNNLWKDGPFSHVSLNYTEKTANEMAEFLDNMNVGEQSVSLEWIDKTAILTVNTMMGVDTKERIFKAYEEIARNKTETLIIDLRNNKGGTFAGIPLVGHVISDTIDVGMFVSRKWWDKNEQEPSLKDIQGLAPWKGWSLRSFWNDVQKLPVTRVQFEPMHPHFNGLVYILTSKETASAAEFTADAFAHEEKVTIIGETTAGEMLSQKMFDLPYGFQLSLPIAEYYSTRIGRIEGKGVQPHIAIEKSVAMDLTFLLINDMELDDALAKTQNKILKMNKRPLGDEVIYMFGNMNDWGKDWNNTPKFEYKGNGIYKAKIKLEKRAYEFKIAPMNWSFDFGATQNQEKINFDNKVLLSKGTGSDNLRIDIKESKELIFYLDLSDETSPKLTIKQV